MSEAVKNSEIEDVLSSIRRLVSEDILNVAKSDTAQTMDASTSIVQKPEAPARLVLTPAFRVDTASDHTRQAENDLSEARLFGDETMPTDVFLESSSDAELDADTAESPAEIHTEATTGVVTDLDSSAAKDGPETDPSTVVQAEDGAAGDVVKTLQNTQDDDAQTSVAEIEGLERESGWNEGPTLENEDAPLFRSRQSEDTEAIDAQIDIEPTENKESGHEKIESAGLDQVQAADEADAQVDIDADVQASNQPDILELTNAIASESIESGADKYGEVAKSAERLSSLERTISDLEAVIGEQDVEWEPDGSEEVGSSPEVEPLQWRRHTAATESSAVPAADDVQEAAPDSRTTETVEQGSGSSEFQSTDPEVDLANDADGYTLFDEDETIIDEEALRSLVSDLVREELQGALGERITHNVHKLVRREIHLAITRLDLD